MKLGRIIALLILVTFGCDAAEQSFLLPEPPQQNVVWTNNLAVPPSLASAAETLFAQGFPNPNGCEYREIEVNVSGVWGGEISLAKTHGWVLPASKGSSNRFAICWNGLIYPVTSVSGRADLREEITNAGPYHGSFRFNNGAGEVRTVFLSNALSTRVLLLLRCGEAETAVKLWTPDSRAQYMLGNEVVTNDPYLELASDWAWAMFDRVICAHMRGDDSLALATARQLAEVQPKIETESARRGFRRQEDFANRGKQKPYLDFLEQLPQLLTDLERRQKEGTRASILESGAAKTMNQSARIAALIHDLDLVHARQWGQPGWVNVAEDPIVSALIEEGDPAVEPLLTCLETDDRLTRSVGFGRDFFRNRTVISVKSAAKTALQSILQASFNSAPEIRAYWRKYGGMNLDERCYAILRDDTASSRWLEAAGHITQPTNQITYPGGYSTIKPVPTNTPVALRGEALRSRTNPSITDLMVRRATEIPTNNPNAYDLGAGCEMALRLDVWDPDAAVPVAKTLINRCATVLKYSGDGQQSFQAPPLGRFLTKLTVIAARSGNADVFDNYASWLQTTTPEELGPSVLEYLEPMAQYPTNPVMQLAARKLFAVTNEVWGKLPWKGTFDNNPAASDLVRVLAFQELLSRQLTNKTLCGTVQWRAPNWISFEITNALHMGSGAATSFPASQQPADGAKENLRWCDWIAWSLSSSKQIPFFNPFAPPDKRDAEIQRDRELLTRR